MAELQQISPPGFIVSYNNAALSLAGRIIEKVTGSTYERAIRVLRPRTMARSGNPAGGMTATVRDQLRWARFHLDHGRAADGTQAGVGAIVGAMGRLRCGYALAVRWRSTPRKEAAESVGRRTMP